MIAGAAQERLTAKTATSAAAARARAETGLPTRGLTASASCTSVAVMMPTAAAATPLPITTLKDFSLNAVTSREHQMKTILFKLVAAGGLGMSAAPALAEPYYFHQPGIDRESYAVDVTQCRELAGMGEVQRVAAPYSANIYATMATAFLGGFLRGAEKRRHHANIERICMADKGYTRMSIEKTELKRIRELEHDEARMDALFTLASAPQAIGEELPE